MLLCMIKNKIKIVAATTNAGKLKEFRDILSDFDVVTVADVGFFDEIEENGQTFIENARLKAKTVCEAVGLPTLGDDSGLCVDALGGAPGIYSARYSGQGVPANRKLLLKNLQGEINRSAHFNCAVALVFPDGREYVAEGQTYGEITTEETNGGNGFGYDKIFKLENDKIVSQLSNDEKNQISARSKAAKLLLEKLNKRG